jgi:hypothetical protein
MLILSLFQKLCEIFRHAFEWFSEYFVFRIQVFFPLFVLQLKYSSKVLHRSGLQARWGSTPSSRFSLSFLRSVSKWTCMGFLAQDYHMSPCAFAKRFEQDFSCAKRFWSLMVTLLCQRLILIGASLHGVWALCLSFLLLNRRLKVLIQKVVATFSWGWGRSDVRLFVWGCYSLSFIDRCDSLKLRKLLLVLLNCLFELFKFLLILERIVFFRWTCSYSWGLDLTC